MPICISYIEKGKVKKVYCLSTGHKKALKEELKKKGFVIL